MRESARDTMWHRQYRDVLRSDRWARIRMALIAETGGRCEHCREKASHLQVHHKSYEHLGCERRDDVELLCRICHFVADWERDCTRDERSAAARVRNSHRRGLRTYVDKKFGEHVQIEHWMEDEFNDWLERQ